MTDFVNFIFHIMKISNFRHKLAFKQVVRFKSPSVYHEFEGRIEKSVSRIAVWHHEACRAMTNGDPEGWIFYPTFTRIMDFFLAHHCFYLSIYLFIYLF